MLSISLTLANRSRDLRGSIYLGRATLCQDSLFYSLSCVPLFVPVDRSRENTREGKREANRYRLQKIISNYLVIIDSKKNVIVVGSLLFTIYTSVSIDNYNKTVIISRVFRSVARCKRFSLSRNIVERSTRKAYLYSRQKGKTWK